MGLSGAAGKVRMVPLAGMLGSTTAQPMAHLSRRALQDLRVSQESAVGVTRAWAGNAAAQGALAAATGWRSGYRCPTLRLSPHEL